MIRKLLSTSPGRWLLPALMSITFAGPVHAQVPTQVHPGDLVRIRLDHESRPRTGRLITIDQDSIVLAQTDDPGVITAVPRAAVSRAWVSRGRSRKTLQGLLIGLGVGAVTGTALGAIAYHPCQDCLLDFGRGVSAALGGTMGSALGLVTGGVVGFATRREKWQPVETRVRVGATGHGGFALAVRLPL